MKKLVTSLSLLTLFVPLIVFAGPGPSAEDIAQHPPLNLEKFPTYHSDLSSKLTKAISAASQKKAKLEYRGAWHEKTSGVLPDDVCAVQLQETYRWGLVTFVFAAQPNDDAWREKIAACSGSSGPDWVGVLASADGGKTWEKFFSVPVAGNPDALPNEEWCRWSFSPIALFAGPRGRILLDVKNGNLCGAGSGEGDFIRFVSADQGRTWTWNACYYFIPEAYYHYPKGDYDHFTLRRSLSLTKLRRMNTKWESRMPMTDCPYGEWPGYWAATGAAE